MYNTERDTGNRTNARPATLILPESDPPGRYLTIVSLFPRENLQTHPCIVIGTLPEAGLVIIAVDGAVGTDAPEPFAVDGINQVLSDIFQCI